MEYEEISRRLQQCSQVYFYGAGIIAYGAYRAIKELCGITVKAFFVTDICRQPCQIEGVPVYSFFSSFVPDAILENLPISIFVIATPEEYHCSIERILIQKGIYNYIKLDSHTEYILMGKYLKKKKGSDFRLIEEYQKQEKKICSDTVGIYMAVSHRDKKLSKVYCEKPWIKKIQVGAALTDERISALTDEGTDSLSAENNLYGELTASYYAWKHNIYKITGLFHYRRILAVSEEQLNLIDNGIIDVILPLPFVCFPDVSGQYKRYILQKDTEIMLQVIKERELDQFTELCACLKRWDLYNYNMMIAAKEVFDDYCRWIFPMLKEITYRCEKTKTERLPRYIGRIGEVLTSLYFMRNIRNWKIAHAEKVWRI